MAPEMLVISLTIIWSEMIKYSSLWTIVDGVFGYNGKNEDVWDACLVRFRHGISVKLGVSTLWSPRYRDGKIFA